MPQTIHRRMRMGHRTIFWPSPLIRHWVIPETFDSNTGLQHLKMAICWYMLIFVDICWYTLDNSVWTEIAQLHLKSLNVSREVRRVTSCSGVGEIRWSVGNAAAVLPLIQAKRPVSSWFGWDGYARLPWTTSLTVVSVLNSSMANGPFLKTQKPLPQRCIML